MTAEFQFQHVSIDSMATYFPPGIITSSELEDRVSPLYERLKIPHGTLEKVSGVKTRRLWPLSVMPSEIATQAARVCLEQSEVPIESIGAIFSCSVARDFLEPATASLVHRNLGLPETCMALDVTNACIGFSNGIILAANLIESGAIKACLLVSGENVSPLLESTVKYALNKEDINREELLKILPVFTLGSGGVAMLITHESISRNKHKVVAAIARSATQHNDLCVSSNDVDMSNHEKQDLLMYTDSAKIITEAAKLGGRMFKAFTKRFGWTRDKIQHVFCHQVGKQVNGAFYNEMGLDMEKEYTIYRDYGNLVSAALPAAFVLGAEEKGMQPGEKAILTAFGSGLNSIFIGIEW